MLAMPAERAYVPNVTPLLITAEDLLHTSIADKHVELVRGVMVVREPPGYLHGDVTARIATLLTNYADERGIGRVLAAETGFKLQSNPDTVRAADVAFLRRERLPDPRPTGYPALAPDLVVEVLSPGDRPGETFGKIGDWLEGGVRLVWVIDPDAESVAVYRPGKEPYLVNKGEELTGDEVLPDFRVVVDEFFKLPGQ